ncbi:hypothetical protein SAMN05216326_14614, partial [Nitrosomonas marina]
MLQVIIIHGNSMSEAYRRHDLSDHVWSLLEPHLPGRSGK